MIVIKRLEFDNEKVYSKHYIMMIGNVLDANSQVYSNLDYIDIKLFLASKLY